MVNYKLYLIRHGMTADNKEGLYTGRMDVPLCAEGIEELNALCTLYQYPDVDEIYSSPLLRCQQTAEIIYPDRSLTLVDDLTELSLGDFEGRSIESLKGTESYERWLSDSYHNAPPNALENGQQFAVRIAQGINSIFMNMCQEGIHKAAVITHGGVIMGLMSGFAFPRLPMGKWALAKGCGFEIAMSSQMWMRDNAFEYVADVPIGFDNAADLSNIEDLKQDEKE